jgi:hypothetical protein
MIRTTPDGTLVRDADSSAGGVHLVTVGGETTPYITIAAALADAVAGDLVLVGPGTYTESVTVPASVSLRASGGVVGIVGTVTLLGDSTLAGLQITSAAGGTCVSADQGGSGGTADLRLERCELVTSGGGTALLASAASILVTGSLEVTCPASTGVSLVAGDAAGERTRFTADRLCVSGAGVLGSLVTADGAALGDERVWVEVDELCLEIDTGSVGVNWGSTGAPAETFPNGAFVGHMACVPAVAGASNTFFRSVAPNGNHRIGCVDGVVVSDTIFDWQDGVGVVDSLNFPDDGITKDTFIGVQIGGGSWSSRAARSAAGPHRCSA